MVSAVILGLVEGITEFLPISSTGHLLIAESLLKVRQSDAFNVCIQIGPIVAVVLVFFKDIIALLAGFASGKTRGEVIKLASCFVITGILGLAAKKLGLKLPETILPVAIATFIGGIIIFWAERTVKGKTLSDMVTWPIVFAVAFGQILAAVFPGTSRSGAAIIAALLLGLARPAAVRFAFLVGIPTMFAAGALQIKEAISAGAAHELMATTTIIAFIVATVSAWLAVVWLLRFVQRQTFVGFAWYRVALGGILIALVLMGIMQ
jgi:undecaprenyl-diphosphatase